jgi:hypothetical protein
MLIAFLLLEIFTPDYFVFGKFLNINKLTKALVESAKFKANRDVWLREYHFLLSVSASFQFSALRRALFWDSYE